jgi:hypothetical protein
MNPLVRSVLDLRNSLDLALRNRITWSPAAHEEAEDHGGLFDDLAEPAAARDFEARALRDYGLGTARDRMASWRWNRNLAFLEVLDRAGQSPRLAEFLRRKPSLRVLDVGSKNFDYVDALAAFFAGFGSRRPVALTGIEVDAHRRYTDFRTRRAWADHYCAGVPGSRYLAQDLEDHREPYDLITWFLPFLTEFPLVRWGLPTRLLRPEALFDHAWGLLEPGGPVLLVNLNAGEAERQHALVRSRGLSPEDLGVVRSTFLPERKDQRLTLVWKDGD